MTSSGAVVEARHAYREANARIALALSILRGGHWCPDCRAAADQADSALLGANVADLDLLADLGDAS